MAQSRHADRHPECPLLGVKRTSRIGDERLDVTRVT